MSSSKPYAQEETLREMYVEQQMHSTEIADELGCSSDTVLYHLRKHGIEVRPSAGRLPEEHKKWEGIPVAPQVID